MLDLLTDIEKRQSAYEQETTPEERKAKGQIFTPSSVSRFMAALLGPIPQNFRLLDPGAGAGALSAAVCERVAMLRKQRALEIHAFEADSRVAACLADTLKNCKDELERAGHQLSYHIHNEDFIEAAAERFGELRIFRDNHELPAFDAVVMNPPYSKISKECRHARLLAEVVHGQPNIYALFLAAAAELLRPGGELVAITPRSFCNGPYFRAFRHWFFDRMSLERIHLFESRKDTFRDSSVLQESVVTVSKKADQQNQSVAITTSFGQHLAAKAGSRKRPAAQVIDDTCGQMVVRIPTNATDEQVMRLVDSWPQRFSSIGLRVSTGPVVAFRARPFLLPAVNGDETVPLFTVHNVRSFETVWPLARNGRPQGFVVCPDSMSLLLPTRNYVLLRRFTAKEEHRRLVAAPFYSSTEPYTYVALENHLNYIYHTERELSDAETLGITALLNSALIDTYFRTISGNTQVNAAEIRALPFPNLPTIERLGRRLKRLKHQTLARAEHIVLEELSVPVALANRVEAASS